MIGIARSADKLQQMKDALGENFTPISCDVSKKEDIELASNQILKSQNIPQLFFLNAGLAGNEALEEKDHFDSALHEKMMDVNYFGVIRFIDAFQKPCILNGGANFIVTGSVNAMWTHGQASAYGASKAAITRAFKSLSLRFADTSLKFSVVYAGPVSTKALKGDLPLTWKPEDMAK